MPQDRGQRRKHSRSLSPVPSKQKRSWQNDGSSSAGGDGRRSQRPRSPLKRDKKHFKSPPKFHDHKDYRPPMGGGYKGRSSPHSHKRSRPLSPFSGPSQGSSFPRAAQSPPHARDPGRKEHRPSSQKERSESRLPRRSASPRPPAKVATDRAKHEDLFPKSAPLSSMGNSGDKKKTPSSPPPKRNRSLTPPVAAPPKRAETVAQQKISTERKVSSSGKKKTSRVTLHKRFTLEDQQPFELEENVTIAILRNPNAEPSEDVTVKKVFDPSLFKMVHKKNEGRKPIFDREEIKVWRHDENFTDDPDFERRLVRVKSTSSTSKPNTDSLSRMSPDVIRKAFGLQLGGRSGSKSPLRSRSPHREPQIRLDPKPDPRYESKFREQLEREEEIRGRRRSDEQFGLPDKAGDKMDTFDSRRNDRGKGETYDLRQALERRRSDRVEGSGFRIEVQRGDAEPGPELYYREDNPRHFQAAIGARNVVFDQDKAANRRFGSADRDSRSWDNDRRTVRKRGRGGGRGRRRPWSPQRDFAEGDLRREDIRDRRPRYSVSPPRGWRGNFRARGRGRGRDFLPYEQDIITSPSHIDDSFKYTQHDDRDLSPKPFRGRGGRGRFPARSFGSSNFRMMNRGGFRGGNRGFRGGYNKRGFSSASDRRSVERRNTSLDREWKHDMYDTLQSEVEQPHSTTLGN